MKIPLPKEKHIDNINSICQFSDKTRNLVKTIIDSMPITPKWAYCMGGEIDTQIVPYDFPNAPRIYLPIMRDIQNIYMSEPPWAINDSFYECEVKKVCRFVTHTIRDKSWCYDITFADTAVILICDPLLSPKEVPHIYEMCWAGREIHNIDRYLKTSVDVCNMSQKDANEQRI